MRISKVITVFIVLAVFSPVSTYAYGGGGFPPGFPFPSRFNLVCEYETRTINLPFDRTFTFRIPRCHVEATGENNNEFKERWEDFLDRIRNGSN